MRISGLPSKKKGGAGVVAVETLIGPKWDSDRVMLCSQRDRWSALADDFRTFVLTAFAALAVAGMTSDWEEYTDNELHVAFSHPKDWKPSPQYSDRTYFGGPDGEVQLDASEGDSPEKVCRGAASHKLQPFGSHPQIKPTS